MSIRVGLSCLFIVFITAYAFSGEHEELLTATNDFCKLKHTDQLINRLYQGEADYVVNGNVLPMKKYLEALEDARSMGTAGAYNDTIGVHQVSWSATLGAVQVLTTSHNRIDDEETTEIRVNLMVFRKELSDRAGVGVPAVWKLQAWYSMTMPKEDRE